MIEDALHSGKMSRLLPGIIYEMKGDGPCPQGPSLATLQGTILPPDEEELERSDLAGFGLGPGAEPVPGYRLVARIGKGNSGEVWKAFGPGGFPVAMKFVGMGERDATDELNSLSLMRDVRHVNLLTIFGTWELDGLLVVGMDLADGTLLGRWDEAISRGNPGIPFRELANYMEQAARGLDFLNQPRHLQGCEVVGLIHRDIKPQNLLLVGGSVKVGDFGLVASLGQTGGICGSESLAPAYVPPEWAEGRLSRRSDQYGLAMTYCHLGAGCLPSPTNGEGRDYSPDELNLSMFPKGQRKVLARALASNPEDRWPDCQTFVKELIRVIPIDDLACADHLKVRGDRSISSEALLGVPAGVPRGRRLVVAAASLTLLILAAGQWFHRFKGDREPQGLTRVLETPSAPVVSESTRRDVSAIREEKAIVDVVAERSTSSLTGADLIATIAAMTAPARGQLRHAFDSLRECIASLERKKSLGWQGMKPGSERIQEPDPVGMPAEYALFDKFIHPAAYRVTSGLFNREVPGSDQSRLVAIGERKAIEPAKPAAENLIKATTIEAILQANERALVDAIEASRPKTATITVLLPNANAELVVRGDVGKGDPDEWYGPKRVIHTPPLGEQKDYLVGSFWTDQDGRQQTRTKELTVKPGRSYEVDLRSPVPTFKEVDRSSLIHTQTERRSP